MIDMMRHNFGIKLFSLLLAFSTWGFLRIMDPVEERYMVFEVEERLGDKALVTRIPQDDTINVMVTGPVSQLDKLQGIPVKVILDGRGIIAGTSKMVSPRIERRFTGLQYEFEPPQYELTVEEKNRKNYVPEEVTDGMLPAGYFIDERIGLPQEVMVEGAVSVLARVDKVVYHLFLSGMTGSSELNIEFFGVDASGDVIRYLNLTPPSANLQISLRSSQAVKTVPIVVDYQGTLATNYTLYSMSIDPPMVDVSGPPESLLDISSVRTAPIELTGKTSSFSELVDLLAPSDNIVLTVESARVSMEIKQIDTTFTFQALALDQRGKDSNYNYELSVDQVDITIRGGPSRVVQITADLVRPQVDFTGLGPGVHNVPISVALPSGVRKDNISPAVVSVTITEHSATDGNQPDGNNGDNNPS